VDRRWRQTAGIFVGVSSVIVVDSVGLDTAHHESCDGTSTCAQPDGSRRAPR
jgi:hypothetical protein